MYAAKLSHLNPALCNVHCVWATLILALIQAGLRYCQRCARLPSLPFWVQRVQAIFRRFDWVACKYVRNTIQLSVDLPCADVVCTTKETDVTALDKVLQIVHPCTLLCWLCKILCILSAITILCILCARPCAFLAHSAVCAQHISRSLAHLGDCKCCACANMKTYNSQLSHKWYKMTRSPKRAQSDQAWNRPTGPCAYQKLPHFYFYFHNFIVLILFLCIRHF